MNNIDIKSGGLEYLSKIAFRNIFRNFRRSLLCIIAIGVAVFFIIGAMGLIGGMMSSIPKVLKKFETGDIYITTQEYEKKKEFMPLFYPINYPENEETSIEQISAIEGVEKVLPRMSTYTTLTDNVVKNAILWGIDFDEENGFHHLNMRDKNNGIVKGRYPEKTSRGSYKNECVLGVNLAEKMNIQIGDRIPMKFTSSQYSDKFYLPKVVGIIDYDYSSINKNYIIIPYDRLQKMAYLSGKSQILYIYIDEDYPAQEIAAKIDTLLNTGRDEKFVIKTWKENYFASMVIMAQFFYGIIYAVFIIVASFLIVNTITMIIHERLKEIGMMGSLGMTRTEIVGVFFLEAFYLSLIGSIAGVLTGSLFNFIGSFFPIDLMTMTGGVDMPASNTLYIKSSLLYTLSGFLLGVIISSCCTIIPSLRAAFIEPVEALRR